jgi:hypothetical protein
MRNELLFQVPLEPEADLLVLTTCHSYAILESEDGSGMRVPCEHLLDLPGLQVPDASSTIKLD